MDKNRLREARQRELLLTPHPPQPCHNLLCDPQNEIALIRRGLLAGPHRCPEFLYLCKYGEFHLCSEICTAEGPCLVSGVSSGLIEEYSSYNRTDHRTWGLEVVRASRPDYYAQVEHVVDSLLYSPIRQRIALQNRKLAQRRLKKLKTSVVTNALSKNKPVNMIHLAMLTEKHSETPADHATGSRDAERVDRYVKLVLGIYRQLPEKTCVETLTLGVLFKLRTGLVVDGEECLAQDLFLRDHLPSINSLEKLGFDKKKVTRGEKLLLLPWKRSEIINV